MCLHMNLIQDSRGNTTSALESSGVTSGGLGGAGPQVLAKMPIFRNRHKVAEIEQLPAASSSLWGPGAFLHTTWVCPLAVWPAQEADAIRNVLSRCPRTKQRWEWKPSLKPGAAAQKALDPSVGQRRAMSQRGTSLSLSRLAPALGPPLWSGLGAFIPPCVLKEP